MIDFKRVAAVTAGLVMVGGLVGAALGALLAAGVLVVAGGPVGLLREPGLLLMGGVLGGGFGVVLGPAAALLLMRHVPLWVAIGGTALGTFAGGAVGLAVKDILLGPLVGFTLSAVAIQLFVPGVRARSAGDASA